MIGAALNRLRPLDVAQAQRSDVCYPAVAVPGPTGSRRGAETRLQGDILVCEKTVDSRILARSPLSCYIATREETSCKSGDKDREDFRTHPEMRAGGTHMAESQTGIDTLQVGGLLRRLRRRRQDRLRDIAARAQRMPKSQREAIGGNTAYFSRLERGKVELKPEQLRALARAYEVDLLLLLPCLSVPVQGSLSLTLSSDFVRSSLLDHAADSSGATYGVPLRRLHGTDLEMLRLSLEPSGRSRSHSHPGEELLLLVSGENVEVVLEQTGVRGQLARDSIFQFDSSQQHFVENRGTHTVVILVIRNRRQYLQVTQPST